MSTQDGTRITPSSGQAAGFARIFLLGAHHGTVNTQRTYQNVLTKKTCPVTLSVGCRNGKSLRACVLSSVESANSLVGTGRDVLGKRYFFPADPKKVVVDRRIHDLSDFVKELDLYDKLARVDNTLWDYIYLYAIQTSIWRQFPNLKVTDIVEDRASGASPILEKSILWLNIDKTIAANYSRDLFPSKRFQIEISQLLEQHDKEDSNLLRHRNYEISFRDPAGTRYYSATPNVGRDWLKKVRKTTLSSDESVRLVQAYFFDSYLPADSSVYGWKRAILTARL